MIFKNYARIPSFGQKNTYFCWISVEYVMNTMYIVLWTQALVKAILEIYIQSDLFLVRSEKEGIILSTTKTPQQVPCKLSARRPPWGFPFGMVREKNTTISIEKEGIFIIFVHTSLRDGIAVSAQRPPMRWTLLGALCCFSL